MPDFVEASIERTAGKVRVYNGDGAVRAAERASLCELENPDLGINAFPERDSIRQRQAERLQIETCNYLICAKRPGVTAAQGGIDTAQNDFRLWLKSTDILNDFLDPEIPVGHDGLHKYNIEPPRG